MVGAVTSLPWLPLFIWVVTWHPVSILPSLPTSHPSFILFSKKKKKKEIEEAYKTTNQEQKKMNKSDNYESQDSCCGEHTWYVACFLPHGGSQIASLHSSHRRGGSVPIFKGS